MKNYWDSELTGKIEYGMLESIIARYFQVHQGINIKYLDLNPLKDSIEEKEPTFVVETEFGKTHYTISIADLQEIVKEYLALKNYELKEMNFTDKGAHIIFKRMSNEREESTYNTQKNKIKIQNPNRKKANHEKTTI